MFSTFLLFFLAGKLGKVLVQVDLVADGHDDVAEHGFVFAMLVADVGQRTAGEQADDGVVVDDEDPCPFRQAASPCWRVPRRAP